MLTVTIRNYFYQYNGIKYWFTRFDDAILFMKRDHKQLYNSLMNPEVYVIKVDKELLNWRVYD